MYACALQRTMMGGGWEYIYKSQIMQVRVLTEACYIHTHTCMHAHTHAQMHTHIQTHTQTAQHFIEQE